ncbi:MAG TPA: DUF4147 domain-containing protein [Acidobacteriaceae bacterium]
MRLQLRQIFAETMEQVQVTKALQHAVRCVNGVLRIGELQYTLADFDRIVVVSIGKAAVPMCDYFAQMLQPELAKRQQLEGVIVGSELLHRTPAKIRYFHGSHPVPDESSRAAAVEIMGLLHTLNARSLVFFLISGGGSAMVEHPLDPSISVEQTAAFYQGLLHSGLSIVEMNVLRKHFSAVKGGRMAEAAGAATQCTVLVSDVPEGELHMVSSGPTLPDPSTLEECSKLIRARKLENVLPGVVIDYLRGKSCRETPKATSAVFERAHWICLLSNERLLESAAALAKEQGYTVVIDNSCDDWEYRKAADYLLRKLKELSEQHEQVCLLSGGEIAVEIHGRAGVGGRNQHFALYSATQLDEYFRGQNIGILSAGSDGVDGNSSAAGAVADISTIRRAKKLGIDPTVILQQFDSGNLFEKLGDAIVTGPTGNNLRDIRMLLSVR